MTQHTRAYPVTPDLDEHELWKEFAEPLLQDLRPNVRSICEYGFTEMVNNVIDHSGSSDIVLQVERADRLVQLLVTDRGVGVFRKIRDALHLASEHAAALELTKGRVTTDPQRHTGEGIFFTARMFDSLLLMSGEIAFHFAVGHADWWHESQSPAVSGTIVGMNIDPSSDRTTREVFDRFAGEERDFQFDTTVLGLRLFGEESGHLVSRSQGKRLLARLEQFKTVILDFEGIQEIGPAFADEVFRVFPQSHPEIRIVPVNASENVNRMILRALTRNSGAGTGR